MEHSELSGGRKDVGMKSLRTGQWIAQEIMDAAVLSWSRRKGGVTARLFASRASRLRRFESGEASLP
eukprot:2784375-Rhodomonas_salina.1